jgi:hypothetical protein
MRDGGLIGLVLAAALHAVGCTDPNPKYRVRVVIDGGGGTGGSDGPATIDGPPQADADTFDGPPALDAEATADAAEPDTPDGPSALPDTADSAPDAVVQLDTASDLPPDAWVPPAGCGTMVTNVSGINNADGVVVDTDGFIYTLNDDATNSYVGKIPPGGTADDDWLTVTNSPTTWGLALDSPGHVLYVLVVDGPGALVRYQNIKGTASGDQLYSGIVNGNDVVVGPDGHVYYTQQSDQNVYAIAAPAKTRRKVSATPIGSPSQLPAALTFAPDGKLLVGTEGGPIYRLTLTNGAETDRDQLMGWTGGTNGMTHDHLGRLYVAQYHDTQSRPIVRLNITGSTVTTVTNIGSSGRYSSIAFGRDPLDCRDLYVANPFGAMQRVRVPDALTP